MDESALFPLIFILPPVVIVGAVIWYAFVERKKRIIRLRGFAARLGIDFHDPKNWMSEPHLVGSVRGKRVDIFTYSTGSGKTKKTWAAIDVTPAISGQFTFAMTRQGLFTKVRSVFGAKEILVDDKGFDDRWFIESSKPDFFRAALIPELRDRFDASLNAGNKAAIKFNGSAVHYEEQGSFSEKRCVRYEALIPLLCDLADLVEVEASLGANR